MASFTSSTFDTLFETFEKSFANNVPAAALMWWWTNSQLGVRVEVPSLGKEFSNGINIGRDPEGYLFFNDIGDLTNNVSFDVYYNTVTDTTQSAFVIQFYNIGDTSAQSFAKFLAKDPNGYINHKIYSTGTWADATANESASHIVKTCTSGQFTLTVPSIHKKVTFSTSSSIKTRVDTIGQLIWKDINKITNGVYVDYRDNRIVFTDTKEWSKDFCAFFLPLVTTESPNPLGSYHLRGETATWSATS